MNNLIKEEMINANLLDKVTEEAIDYFSNINLFIKDVYNIIDILKNTELIDKVTKKDLEKIISEYIRTKWYNIFVFFILLINK